MRFHRLARGIAMVNGKVLLARQKGAENTFLPGGHIHVGEKAEAALEREIEEELGKKAIVKGFVGEVACTWSENGQDNHEINLVFEVELPDTDSSAPPPSGEAHLEFIWAKPAELESHNLQPFPMVKCIMDWMAGPHPDAEGKWKSPSI